MRKIITAITTAVVINKMVSFMTKNEPGVELNIGFRIFPYCRVDNRYNRMFGIDGVVGRVCVG